MKKAVKQKEVMPTLRTSIKCPYCYTTLQYIEWYATRMICWHCKKEFIIEEKDEKE